jgi:hypothetical protein
MSAVAVAQTKSQIRYSLHVDRANSLRSTYVEAQTPVWSWSGFSAPPHTRPKCDFSP